MTCIWIDLLSWVIWSSLKLFYIDDKFFFFICYLFFYLYVVPFVTCAMVWKIISWILNGFCIPGIRSVVIFSDICISINIYGFFRGDWFFCSISNFHSIFLKSLLFIFDILSANFFNSGIIYNQSLADFSLILFPTNSEVALLLIKSVIY